MGFSDFLLGESPDVTFRHKRTGQQVQMGGDIYRLLSNLFQQGPGTLLPTAENYQQLAPQIYEGMMQPINLGAQQLTEQLMGSGIMGGSAGSALADYYGRAMPQVGMNIANMITPALRFPYALGAGLWPSTQQNTATPIVSQGSQGLLGGMMQLAAPLAMGAGFALGGPMGAALGSAMGNFFSPAPQGSNLPVWGGSYTLPALSYRGYGF